MRIGIVIDELISGGFQKVAVMEAKYLQILGFDVSLVVLHRTKTLGYQDVIKENNINVVYLSDRLPLLLKLNFHFPFFAFFSFFHIFYPFFIYRYIKKEEFDTLLIHGTYTAFSGISIKKKLNIPYICFIHDSISYILPQKYHNKFLKNLLWILMPIAKYLDRLIIEDSKVIIAFPEMLRELRKISPDYENYLEIYNGCELLSEKELVWEKNNYAIAATKWDQGKNFHFLVNLWKKSDIQTPLKIIGTFSPISLAVEYKSLIERFRLEKVIDIVGPVSEKELREHYKKAKFLIHPCREAFGMTILESAACGCPSIFTNNSGVAELFPEEILSSLPNENDVETYTKYLNKIMLSSKEEYTYLSKEYYNVALSNSWKKHCELIKNLIK